MTKQTVSTHSHPKVAAYMRLMPILHYQFQHTATRRWLLLQHHNSAQLDWFQHTATRRWLRRHQRRQHPTHRFNTQPPEGGW